MTRGPKGPEAASTDPVPGGVGSRRSGPVPSLPQEGRPRNVVVYQLMIASPHP